MHQIQSFSHRKLQFMSVMSRVNKNNENQEAVFNVQHQRCHWTAR